MAEITPAGKITEYPMAYNAAGPVGIVTGPDGRFYIANSEAIVVFDPISKASSELPNLPTAWRPILGSIGPNKTMWFTDPDANALDVVTTSGPIAQYPIPTASADPQGLTEGPDGNMWFTELKTNKIGRMTPTGSVTEFQLSSNAGPAAIVAGPDHNVWFSEAQDLLQEGGGKVGRITLTGQVTEFDAQGRGAMDSIAVGPDGNIWVGAVESAELVRVTLTGAMTFFAIPSHTTFDPTSLVAGPDGNLWFNEPNGGRIGKVLLH